MVFQIREAPVDRSVSGNLKEYVQTRKFWVTSIDRSYLDRLVAPAQIANLIGIPIFGSAYVSPNGYVDFNVFLNKKNARVRESPWEWEVDCEYTNVLNRATDSTSLGQYETPTAKPPERRWGSTKFTRAIFEDNAGAAMKNSAGAPFSPAVEIEEARLTLTVVHNRIAYDPVFMSLFICSVNSATWYGFAPHRVKCNGISAVHKYESGIFYHEATFEFEFAQPGKTWAARILDSGHYYLSIIGPAGPLAPPGEPRRFRDAFGQPLANQGLLDGSGGKLPQGNTPVFLDFDVYPETDFALLGLGS